MNTSRKNKPYTTKGFYFGKSESEGENSYKESENSLFDDYLDIMPQLTDEGCFIVTGRKGSGKSAIAKYIKDNANLENQSFCEIVKSHAIKLEKCIQADILNANERLVSFFQWLIYVKLINFILEAKEGEYTKELKALHNFVRNNSGVVNIDEMPVTECVQLYKQSINIGALQPFRGSIEKVLGKRADMTKVVYHKFLPALKEIVYKVLQFPIFADHKFTLIFDDLDLEFKVNDDQEKQALLDLIRTAKEFNNDVKDFGNAQVIILLRDDIKKSLMGFDADVSKIFSTYEVELNWYDGKDESKTLLREFVNRRIAYNFERFNIPYNKKDPWSTLFNDAEGCYGKNRDDYKSAFKYILDYTFFRPRDLILFLKFVGKQAYAFPINGEQVGELLAAYAKENEGELRGELAIHYNQEQIGAIFDALHELARYQQQQLTASFEKTDALHILQQSGLSEDIFDVLTDYYLLVPFDPITRRYYIGYRGSDSSDFDEEQIQYKVHKCIYACVFPRSATPY